MGIVPVAVTVIPEYEIHGLIKEGGMGQVYKAWNVSLQRFEAIKFIAPHLLASPEIRELFHREAVAVASLDHENIATLYRWGEAGGKPYLAFKYCDGGSLANRIQGWRLHAGEILGYALELASGLEYAHNHGIVHRDVKPANVLFHEGKLKLIDFGLSKYREEIRETSLTSGAGTPQYMSPDQVRGGPVDHRSDIYSLGVIFYEMAAGRRPFESENLQELLRQVSYDQPPPLAEQRPDLGEAFCGLVHRMLAKDPGDRPQSMTEVIARLRECRQEEAGESQPVRAPAPKPMPERTTLLKPVPPPPLPLLAKIGIVAAAAVMAAFMMNPAAILQMRRWTGGGHRPMPLIAVLPFESVSKDAASVEFCGALDARLAGELVRSVKSREHFAVTPTSEVRSYNIRSVTEAHKRLSADFVFGGTVIKNEGGYEILLSLADASNHRQIKAETIRIERHLLDRFDSTLRDAALRMLPPATRAASVLVATAQAFSDPVAYELTVRAQGLLRQYTGPGPVDTALELLAQAVRLDPKSAEAHAWVAEARVQKWQGTRDWTHLEMAEKSASEALSLNPKLAAVRLASARTAQARGDWEKAIAEFNAAIAANPQDPENYRFAGRVYLDSGRPKDAEAAYRKAVELSPNSWTSHSSLGAFYSRQQRWDAALKEFQRAADLYPESPLAQSNLGAAYYKLDRLEDAARAFTTALQRKPNGLAYSNLGDIRFSQGRYTEAAELFEHAVAERPADAAAWCFLGEACARVPVKAARSREALARSVDLLEKELKVNPRNAETWSRVALAKALLGDVRGARTALGTALKLAPEDASVIYRAARTEARLGGTRIAAGYLLAALDKGYPRSEALREPGLEQARKDPRLRARFP